MIQRLKAFWYGGWVPVRQPSQYRYRLVLSLKSRILFAFGLLRWRVTGKDPGTPIPYPFEDDGITPKP